MNELFEKSNCGELSQRLNIFFLFRMLHRELKEALNDRQSIFQKSQVDSTRYVLKEGIEFHLYISQTPCTKNLHEHQLNAYKVETLLYLLLKKKLKEKKMKLKRKEESQKKQEQRRQKWKQQKCSTHSEQVLVQWQVMP